MQELRLQGKIWPIILRPKFILTPEKLAAHCDVHICKSAICILGPTYCPVSVETLGKAALLSMTHTDVCGILDLQAIEKLPTN